jgi:hypothetical protein
MRRSRRFSLLLLLSIIVATVAAGCSGDGDDGSPSPPSAPVASPTASPTAATEGFLTYRNEEEGFTIEYPEEWTSKEGEFGTLVFFAEPPVTGFAANVNVVSEDIPASTTLAQYSDVTEEQLENFVTNLHDFESRPIEVGGRAATEFTYLGTQGNFELRWVQNLVVTEGRAFVITFTAEEDRFAEVEPTGRSILASFRLD